MAMNWKEYELVLEAKDHKVCEVTGRNMGGTSIHTCPVSKLVKNKEVPWKPSYGGYEAVECKFAGTDNEAVHLIFFKGLHIEKALKPDESWLSGWYSFGSWDYCVEVKLRKIASETPKKDTNPFFVHTLTDDGVTSDYADTKEAYEGR